jgi:hypothetical protein
MGPLGTGASERVSQYVKDENTNDEIQESSFGNRVRGGYPPHLYGGEVRYGVA